MDIPHVPGCVEAITLVVHDVTDARSGHVSDGYTLMFETEKGVARMLLHDPADGEVYLLAPLPMNDAKVLEEGTVEFPAADVAELLDALRWSEREKGMIELSPVN